MGGERDKRKYSVNYYCTTYCQKYVTISIEEIYCMCRARSNDNMWTTVHGKHKHSFYEYRMLLSHVSENIINYYPLKNERLNEWGWRINCPNLVVSYAIKHSKPVLINVNHSSRIVKIFPSVDLHIITLFTQFVYKVTWTIKETLKKYNRNKVLAAWENGCRHSMSLDMWTTYCRQCVSNIQIMFDIILMYFTFSNSSWKHFDEQTLAPRLQLPRRVARPSTWGTYRPAN